MPKQSQPGIHLHKTATHISGRTTTQWYWVLIGKNGEPIARSIKPYKTKRSAVRSMKVASDIIRFEKPCEYFDHTGKDAVVGNF